MRDEFFKAFPNASEDEYLFMLKNANRFVDRSLEGKNYISEEIINIFF